MTVTFRPAVPDDAPGIAHVHTTSWAETYPGLMPLDFLARMTDDGMRRRREQGWREQLGRGALVTGEPLSVLVAEQAGWIVAFGSAGPPLDHPGYDAELYTLYALRSVQGGGLGRAILRGLARGQRERGARNLALWVLDVNPTRQWYARQGACEAGEKTDGPLREVRMVWDDLNAVR